MSKYLIFQSLLALSGVSLNIYIGDWFGAFVFLMVWCCAMWEDQLKDLDKSLRERESLHQESISALAPLYDIILKEGLKVAEEEEDYESCQRIKRSIDTLGEYFKNNQ